MGDLNTYGDALVQTTGSHGADIASQRIDRLDQQALVEALAFHPRKAVCIDLGCGLGLQGLRFAALGLETHLYDLLPEPPLLAAVRELGSLDLRYRAGDLRALADRALPARIDLAFSQRFVHYLRYAEALRLSRQIAKRLAKGARFYVSASGIGSELGAGYAHRQRPLAERYATLSPAMQDKHDIREEVCLYSEDDLQQLMQAAGLVCRSIERSAFGNIKGVFEKSA